MTAQQVHHQLAAVADAQHRHAPAEDLGVDGGRILQINAVGAAGEDNAHGGEGPDFRHGHGVRFDLTVYPTFPDSAGDELIILAAKIQNQNLLHYFSPPGM